MITLQDDRLRELIKFFVHKLPDAGDAFQKEVGRFYELAGDTKSGLELKALLAKKFEDLKWKPEISENDMIKLAKKINYGPLYHAIAKRLSPAKRNDSFPELKDKFESIAEAVSDDTLTDELDSAARLLTSKIKVMLIPAAKELAKKLNLQPSSTIRSYKHGVQQLDSALQLLVSVMLDNPKLSGDSFTVVTDAMGEAGMGGTPAAPTGTTTANTAAYPVPLGSLAPSSERGPSYDLAAATKKKKKKKKSKKKGKL